MLHVDVTPVAAKPAVAAVFKNERRLIDSLLNA
jgi:hypothetical protein